LIGCADPSEETEALVKTLGEEDERVAAEQGKKRKKRRNKAKPG
jgi:hypothetical protein